MPCKVPTDSSCCLNFLLLFQGYFCSWDPPKDSLLQQNLCGTLINLRSTPGGTKTLAGIQTLWFPRVCAYFKFAFSCLHSKGAGPQGKICRVIEEITHVWPLCFLKLKANARGKRSRCTGTCTEVGKYTEEPSKSRCRIRNRKAPGIESHCLFISSPLG